MPAVEKMMIAACEVPSWGGTFHLIVSELGICALSLPHQTKDDIQRGVKRHNRYISFVPGDKQLNPFKSQIISYLAGESKGFDVPIDLRGTSFQLDVWRALSDIPYGETRSYADIAVAVGRPKAVRAVGAANRLNLLPLIVPCHRVIGKNGDLTGYSGGMQMKEKLLQLEVRVR